MSSPSVPAGLVPLLRQVLPWLFLLFALYQVRLVASAASGQDSFFEIWVMWMSNAKTTRLSAVIFGLAGVAYGLAQRALRRATEQRLAARIAALEARLPEQTA
jgi:hypothetical protein